MNMADKIVSRVNAKMEQGADGLQAMKAVVSEMQVEGFALGWDTRTVAMIPVTVAMVLLGVTA